MPGAMEIMNKGDSLSHNKYVMASGVLAGSAMVALSARELAAGARGGALARLAFGAALVGLNGKELLRQN